MKKKILLVGIILLLLVGGVLGWAVMNANSLIARYKPQLEQAASKALGADVTLGKLEASIFPSAKVVIDSARIARTKSSPDALTLKNLSLDLSLGPLLQGKLVIVRLALESPTIIVVKDQDGMYLEGLGKKQKAAHAPHAEGEAKPAAAESSGAAEKLAIDLRELKVTQGSLEFKDLTQNKSQHITNIEFQSSISLNGSALSLPSGDFSATLPDNGKAAAQIRNLAWDLKQGTGSLELLLTNFEAQAGAFRLTNGRGTAKCNATATEKSFETSDLSLNIGGEPVSIQAKGVMRQTQLLLEKAVVKAFSGELVSHAELDLSEAQTFTSDFDLSNMNIESLLRALKPDSPAMSGTLAKVSGKVHGRLGPELQQSMQGNVSFLVKDGELKGVNLAGQVLQAVKNLPFLTSALYGSVPQDQRGEVDRDMTKIKSLTGNTAIGGAKIQLTALDLISTIFSMNATGTIAFKGDLDLDATILFSKEFSAQLAMKTKELAAVLDDEGRLAIPLSITGVPPGIVVLPNVSALLKTGAKKAFEQKAGELIDKFMGGKSSGTGSSNSGKGLGGLLGF